MSQAALQEETGIVKAAPGIWSNPRFKKLLISQTISSLGLQTTMMTIPLLASMTLAATPFEMGVLRTVEFLPFLLLGLFVGVWVDHWPKKTVLVISDFGRAAVLSIIPIVTMLGLLNIVHLWIVGFAAGVFGTFSAIAAQSFAPLILEKNQLIDGNGKLEFSRSVSELSGPSIAGLVMQWVTGALAIGAFVVSFLISGIMLCLIQVEQPHSIQTAQVKPSIWHQIRSGFSIVFRNKYLRPIVACSATTNFFMNMMQALLVLYVTQTLGMSAQTIGFLLTLGALGAVGGAWMSNRIVQAFGMGKTIVYAAVLQGVGALFMLGSAGSMLQSFIFMLLSMLITTFAITVYNVAQVTLRQWITEPAMHGRMNATIRTIVWGVIPLGAFIGGLMGTYIGTYNTITVAVIGIMFSFLWVLFSPVRSLILDKYHP